MTVSCRQHRRSGPGRGDAPDLAFTLAELLVVMAIIAIVTTITVVAVGSIANDARISSGRNTVVAALENARAAAMKSNRITLVVFRPRIDADGDEFVEAVTAQWAGDAYVSNTGDVFDRFVPVPTIAARSMPRGIQVAGPYYRDPGSDIGIFPLRGTVYGRDVDELWVTQTSLLRQPAETQGELVGVMYGPDGATLTRNARTDARAPWVDFDNDYQDVNGDGYLFPEIDWGDPTLAARSWRVDHPNDETLINVVPFLAVYDDDAARELVGDDDWTADRAGHRNRTLELTDYISDRADRIHFNRYTGVAMR